MNNGSKKSTPLPPGSYVPLSYCVVHRFTLNLGPDRPGSGIRESGGRGVDRV